jgi:AAHS family 4-hydroxybenzoate transporter-like MFS transporter
VRPSAIIDRILDDAKRRSGDTGFMKTVDVASVLDEGRWSAYQKLLVAGTALAIILDGMDNQLLGNVIPALMKEWSLPRAPFTTVLALGPSA